MQSCEDQNSPKTDFSEDPSQIYEPLKEVRRETGEEQPYQGFVRLDSQGKDTYMYVNVVEKDSTNACTDGEDSYENSSSICIFTIGICPSHFEIGRHLVLAQRNAYDPVKDGVLSTKSLAVLTAQAIALICRL